MNLISDGFCNKVTNEIQKLRNFILNSYYRNQMKNKDHNKFNNCNWIIFS